MNSLAIENQFPAQKPAQGLIFAQWNEAAVTPVAVKDPIYLKISWRAGGPQSIPILAGNESSATKPNT